MKKRLLHFIIFFLWTVQGFSQMAPDFTVTDSDGVTHRLYADYLNKGKTVMLKMFFVSCPPCNQIAPHIESLYQEWGAGDNDVEFFELSIQSNDSNSDVNGYKTQHGLNFPSVGGDGNSVEAVSPYIQGQFGNYTGTPTFVVIAPDGTVNFDVFGLGTQGQLNALSEAFEATGATRPISSGLNTSLISTNDFRVSPNPFENNASLAISLTTGGNLTYQLYNILGTPIQSKNLGRILEGKHVLNVDTSDLKSGTYIIRLTKDDLPIKSIKVVKK